MSQDLLRDRHSEAFFIALISIQRKNTGMLRQMVPEQKETKVFGGGGGFRNWGDKTKNFYHHA
jgi:hypothetical protein